MSNKLSLAADFNKITHQMREKEEQRHLDRRKNLIYLIQDFLCKSGFTDTAEQFTKDAQLSNEYAICDNIDLDAILLEYTEYFHSKYNKYPNICKRVDVAAQSNNVVAKNKKPSHIPEKTNKSNGANKKLTDNNLTSNKKQIATAEPHFEIMNQLKSSSSSSVNDVKQQSTDSIDYHSAIISNNNERKTISISSVYPPTSEYHELAEIISKDILQTNLNVYWDDIKGLDDCKNQLKEATVFPIKYPDLFNGKIKPWQGVLLYGPPGTGKTMLAKAVATECRGTFFNITSSTLISKWRGDSEKYVRVLCDLARHYAPAIIFIDEVDWTVSEHGETTASKSEPVRRFRAEFLTRLDGLQSMENSGVVFLAATNIPWELDVALLRRLEKKIFVGLPRAEDRSEIMSSFVSKEMQKLSEFQGVVEQTDGYSCADLKLLCKEAWMMQMAPIFKSLERKQQTSKSVKYSNLINDLTHLQLSLKTIKPTGKELLNKFHEWNCVNR